MDTPEGPSAPPPLGRQALALYQEPGECDPPDAEETLPQYAKACATAMELKEIPGFDCDDPTKAVEVPDTGSQSIGGIETCDRPNVLNGECDRGSRFQMVVDKETDNRRGRVQIVAHCRKRGQGPGRFEDIAMIAYNSATGDTCFFQNTLQAMDGKMLPPGMDRDGDWSSPASTERIRCIGCHDNGPFVRSPYLTQLKGTPATELGLPPGMPTLSDAVEVYVAQKDARLTGSMVPGSRDSTWNKTQPYRFVGKAFQGWRTYSVSLVENGVGNFCTSCHRMGMAALEVGGIRTWDRSASGGKLRGTTISLGELATAPTQRHKNPHSMSSPIWMPPTQTDYSPASALAYAQLKICGENLAKDSPALGCNAVQFGRGTSCRGGAIVGTVNGGTVAEPTNVPQHDVVDVPIGPDEGFMGWRKLHGPFVQSSRSGFGDATFDGTFAMISVGPAGGYRVEAGWEGAKVAVPRAGAGGEFAVTRFAEIAGIPDLKACQLRAEKMRDSRAQEHQQEVDIDETGSGVDVLWTGIGNVSRGRKDLFGLDTPFPNTRLRRDVYKPANYEAVATAFSCDGWSPIYSAYHVRSTGDVLLAPAAQADRLRCFLTGLNGPWHLTRDDGRVQPFAEIYTSASREVRLRVSPSEGPDAVSATASCIALHP